MKNFGYLAQTTFKYADRAILEQKINRIDCPCALSYIQWPACNAAAAAVD